MRRREFIVALGTAAAGWPLAARPQASRKAPSFRIGFLGPATRSATGVRLSALRTGARELGYEEGKNLTFEFRWADGNDDRLADLATELVGLDVDVLVTYGTPMPIAAQQRTHASGDRRASCFCFPPEARELLRQLRGFTTSRDFSRSLALISSPEATSTEVPSVNPVAPNLPVQRATVIHLGAWLG
jgi:hypothetical protein